MTTAPDIPHGYKQTKIGVIPKDWEVRRFSDHFLIYAGGDVPKESFSQTRTPDHPYPIYANAIKNEGLYGYTDKKRARGNSVTITARGDLGHAVYRNEPFFPIVRLLVLEPIGSLDAKFTNYAIKDRVEFAIESTGVPQLTAPQVGKYAIGAPPTIDEQRAIAEALSDADALIEGLERLIAKKRDIKRAAMQQLLAGKTRLPGFGGKWETTNLGDFGVFSKGRGIRRDQVQPEGLPCIRYGEIYTNFDCHIDEFVSHISPDVAKNSQRLKCGDLLFTGSGETMEEIGKCVAFLDEVEAYAGGDIVIFSPAKGDSRFLGYLMNHETVVDQKSRLGQGDAVVHISATSLSAIAVELPPWDEQVAIAQTLSDMDAEIAALEAKRDKARQIKQGMMQELLTGRIRLV